MPEPAKLSRIIEFLSVETVNINFKSSDGFGKSKVFEEKIYFNSLVPCVFKKSSIKASGYLLTSSEALSFIYTLPLSKYT